MIPPPYSVLPGRPPRSGWLMVRRVLWAATPVASLGFLSWLPSLRFAFRRPTVESWAWFAFFAGATVAEFVFLDGPETADGEPAWIGGYIIALMAAAAAHAFWVSRPRDFGAVSYVQGFGRHHAPYAGQVPGATQPMGGYALYQQTYPDARPPGFTPIPPALDNDAAEVREGLRELRESLERGGDR